MGKKFYPALLFFFVFQTAFGTLPPNDRACTPTFIPLTSPQNCPFSSVDSVSINGSNSGATPDSIHFALKNCTPTGDMPNAAPDVWYTFQAVSNKVEIKVLGLTTPIVALYLFDNNCVTPIPVGCNIGSSGFVKATFENIIPGKFYLIQVEGASVADVGNFTLRIISSRKCTECMQDAILLVNPAPVHGFYNPGDTVTFTYIVRGHKPYGNNHFHGAAPVFGPGWELSTLTTTNTTPPPPVSGLGNWSWYFNQNVPSQGTFSGFFYDGPNPDGNPANNKGDVGNQYSTWVFKWKLRTKSSCASPLDLSVRMHNFSDNESGNGLGLACSNDPDYFFKATLNCCPKPYVSVINENCPNTTGGGVVIANFNPPAPYSYAVINSAGTQVAGTASSASQTFTAANLPTGDYAAITKNGSGCISHRAFRVSNALDINVMQLSAGCQNACNSSAAVTGIGNSTYNYLWTPSNQTTQVATGLCPGSYTVVVTDVGNGCNTGLTITILNYPQDDATITYSPTHNTYYCTVDTAAPVPTYIATPGGNFSWSGNPLNINPNNGAIQLSNPPVPQGIYTVTYISPGPCTDTATFQFEIKESPPTPIVTGMTTACEELQPLTLTVSNAGNNTAIWDLSPLFPNPILGNSVQLPILLPGQHFAYVFMINAVTGCFGNPTTIPVTIFPQPLADAGIDTTICSGFSTSLNGSGGITYYWTPQVGLNSVTSPNPTAAPSATTTYTLTVTDGNGCTDTDFVVVGVTTSGDCDKPGVFNGITPNGDGLNDHWIIEGITNRGPNRVLIFNRWGNKVWEGVNYDNTNVVFSGLSNDGSELPVGTYYYLIIFEDETLKDWLEINR
jgi:gliding motility-associated-like protein